MNSKVTEITNTDTEDCKSQFKTARSRQTQKHIVGRTCTTTVRNRLREKCCRAGEKNSLFHSPFSVCFIVVWVGEKRMRKEVPLLFLQEQLCEEYDIRLIF